MLKRPLITEKTMGLADKGIYTFEVDMSVTKLQIAKLVADRFKVDVVSVKTVKIQPKRKLQRSRRGYLTIAGRRKAIVEVKPGQKIAIFERANGQEEDVTVTTGEGEPIVLKEKKNLRGDTKIKVEKMVAEAKETKNSKWKQSRQQAGKTKGEN